MKAAICGLVLMAACAMGTDTRQNGPLNVLFILADDLGFADIGYKDPSIITPTLDDLAHSGRILTNNYVPSVCTPSRHALMSGKLPYKTTMQHGVLGDATPYCSPLDLDFLPKRLQAADYVSHHIGKWHLGYCREECIPYRRGFESSYGLLHGAGDFYAHTQGGHYDWRLNTDTQWDVAGEYTTDLIKQRTVDLINGHDQSKGLFLYAAFTAVHTPLQVPQKYYDMYPDVQEEGRRVYLAMLTALDEAVQEIVQTLHDTGMYDNTLIIFSSDNGGEIGGNSDNAPLRGCKASLWEGGTRVVGFVHGAMLENVGEEHNGLFHSVDWAPTILSLAGASPDPFLDGVDQTEMIINGGESARNEIVYNIDYAPGSFFGNAAIRVDDWKLMWGHEGYCDGWGRTGIKKYWQDEANLALIGLTLADVYPDGVHHRRSGYSFSQTEMRAMMGLVSFKQFDPKDINSGFVHLFNLVEDPNEENDLSASEPEKVTELKEAILAKLDEYVVPPPEAAAKRITESEEAMEDDPNGSGLKAWKWGWCDDLSLTIGV